MLITGGMVAVLFLTLLTATLLIHTHHIIRYDFRFHPVVRFLDALFLAPYWSFFAPNPGVYSYRLMVRQVYDSGNVSDWKDSNMVPPRSRLSQFLWNPHGRLRKVLLDICNELIESATLIDELSADESRFILQTGIPYIKCVSLASSVPIFPGARTIQFAVIQVFKSQDVRVLLLSGLHRV
jgi:hypothetical protein